MLKLIGVLLLSGHVGVAIDASGGYAERTFSCTEAGVEQLFEFVLSALGPGEPAIQFVVGPIERQPECEVFFAALAENGIGNAVVSAQEIEAFANSHRMSPSSARTVAETFKEKHAKLFSKKRT
ncbi:hypothetical protein GPROT1_01887 [Gammaproteobacteria bacterium]|nr:hypothetical protein GPROT1_01887 [Gammaproteobacteria bacterium]